MGNEIELAVERVISADPARTTCLVRCLRGDLVDGTRLRAVDDDGTAIPAASTLVVIEMIRYDHRVDLVDPPHIARILLDGTLGQAGPPARLVGPA